MTTNKSPEGSLLLKRLTQVFVVLLGISLVYIYSWGRYTYLPEDPRSLETKEKEKLEGEVFPLERAGLMNQELYEGQLRLADHYWFYKHFDRAAKELKARIETAVLLFGEHSDEVYKCTADLGACYSDATKFREADKVYRLLMDKDNQKRPIDSSLIARDLNNLGVLYCMWGQSFSNMTRRSEKFAQSESFYDESLKLSKAANKPGLYKMALHNKAVLLREMGKLIEADVISQEADQK